jgi:cobalt-zinc-cadmium efflux system outer membrane protein
MRSLAGAAIVIAVALPIPCSAAADLPTAIQFSIDEAVSRAQKRSPLVRLAKKERDVVASGRVGAGVLLPANPVVGVTVGHRRDDSGSRPAAAGVEWGARLEQAFEVGGQRGLRLQEADRRVDVAAARLALAQSETRARVRAGYIALLVAEAQSASAAERAELGTRVLAAARARVHSGAAGDVELRLAESEAGRLAHDRLEAQLAVGEAAAALRLLLDLPPAAALTLTTPLTAPAPVAQSLAEATAAARTRRAELRVVAAERSALAATLTRLGREVIPSPALFVDVQRQQPGQLYVGGGLSFSLPAWRRNQGERAVARAEQSRVDEERAILDGEIALEVAQLYQMAAMRREGAALWATQIVPAANATVELVNGGWVAGKFDLFRLVQVSREAGEARRRQLEVLAAWWQATIELDRATGAL